MADSIWTPQVSNQLVNPSAQWNKSNNHLSDSFAAFVIFLKSIETLCGLFQHIYADCNVLHLMPDRIPMTTADLFPEIGFENMNFVELSKHVSISFITQLISVGLGKSEASKHISMNSLPSCCSNFVKSLSTGNVCLIRICKCVTAEFRTMNWCITQRSSASCSREALRRIQYLTRRLF